MAPKSVVKRPAAATIKEPASKRHQGAKDIVGEKCKIVSEALLATPMLPESAKAMLAAIVPKSLGVLSEKRHEHQVSAVAMLAETLAGVEAGLAEGVREAQAGLSALEAEATPLRSAEAAAQTAVEASQARLLERKAASDEAAAALTRACAALEAAKAAQAAGDAAVRGDSAQKARIEAVMQEHFAPLLGGGGGAGPNAWRAIQAVLAMARELHLDNSLITALRTALERAPDERGSFDAMTLRTFESEVPARVAELTARIENAEPAKVERAAVVESATAALDEANAAVVARKEELAASAQEGKDCKAALKSAQAEAATLQPRFKTAKNIHGKAEASLELFRDGPLATFKELEVRSEAKPEVAVPEEAAELEQSP